MAKAALITAMLTLVASCGDRSANGPIGVSVIGAQDEFRAPLTHIDSLAGAISFAATAQGLVSYDDAGNVIPGLAQRWIVVDDGKSYIFRLRRARWANGKRVDARDVRRILLARKRAVVAEDPYGPVATISDILAMTADVIEIRLKNPRPNFLMALALPQMGIAMSDGGSGPYRKILQEKGQPGDMLLTPVADFMAPEEQPEDIETRIIWAERSARAIMRFQNGQSDLVLGGTLADLPFLGLAEVNAGTVRFDPVVGLFGLALSPRTKLFDDPNVREAINMAIEREALIGYFDINRWRIAMQIVPQQLELPQMPAPPDWARQPITERRNLAIGTITRWRAQHDGKPVTLSIALPKGPGMELLFIALRAQLRAIDVDLKRTDRNADLTLVDEVAPYPSVSWYLGRVSCKRKVHCSKEAEELLEQSVAAEDMAGRAELLAQAEPLVQAHNGFIPLATPVRWSLAGRRVNGYSPSPRGYHDMRRLVK
ncbi:MAG: ABC transporter substrate-binding protein [Sphingobium sp.]|nr:ABC transporter substrate-binding protein [Sphingobium sp.]MCP5400212.1 ABC transporter substrate-binding protein [Sphingomonas sp.]